MPEYMTISEVAELLRSSERTVYEWLRVGRIQAYRAGGRWLVTHDQVQHFLENDNRVGGGRFRSVARPAAEVAPASVSQAPGLSGSSSPAPGASPSSPSSPAPGSPPLAATGPKPNPLQNRKKNHRGR